MNDSYKDSLYYARANINSAGRELNKLRTESLSLRDQLYTIDMAEKFLCDALEVIKSIEDKP